MSATLNVLQAILLGVVQGVTEWLPVSSSGHLVLAQHFLGVEVPVFFDLVLHMGTLLVVVVFFRHTIRDVLLHLATIPRDRRGGQPWRAILWDNPHRRLALLVLIGTIPTAILGFAFRDLFVALFESPVAVGFALLATGTLLWLTQYARVRPEAFGWRTAVLVGLSQGLAITPGISRSGATIGAATLLGVDRETAVRYSFLLSIPAILGAAILQTTPGALTDMAANLPAYLAGAAAAIVVGYGALFALVLIVRRNLFHFFALYCWALGGGVLAWLLLA